jgi:hypothetical protein
MTYLHNLKRSANLRTGDSRGLTDPSDRWLDLRVVDMPAVPGQQVVHTMHGCGSHMQRICLRFGGDRLPSNKHPSQFLRPISQDQFGNASENTR